MIETDPKHQETSMCPSSTEHEMRTYFPIARINAKTSANKAMQSSSKLSFLFLFIGYVTAQYPVESDRISELPLFGKPPSPQWSGYLNATEGCDIASNGNDCQLHYWLALQDDFQGTTPTKPLILWLNGGPGASSIVGFLQELGPLLINATGGLMRNPYAWTTVANVFVLESPVGVGYSYCENQQQGEPCYNTDRYTATAARAALQDFFTKFERYFGPSTEFYIAGESYAGVYIPTLAHEILQLKRSSSNITLKGILVGDPCTDNESQQQSRDPLWYSHKNGLVDDTTYETLTEKCRVNIVEQEDGHSVVELGVIDDPELADTCKLALRKFRFSSSKGINGKWDHRFIDHYSLYGIIDTRAEDLTEAYMNRPDVRQALHIPEWLGKWTKHAPLPFFYEKEYAACNHNPGTAPSMLEFYRTIIPKLEKTWIFNGDSDPCVSYEGTRTAVRRIGFPELDGGSFRPWFYNQTGANPAVLKEKVTTFGPNLMERNIGAQWGGHAIHYESNLTFLTVHGSGHMVPMIRPIPALHLLSMFLEPNAMIAPLLSSNATLASMEAKAFDDYIDQWISRAKIVKGN